MKDSSGFPSVTITFLTISFWITTLAYVASVVRKVGPLEFSNFDVGACGAYFGIIFSAYVARRYTDARWGNPNVVPGPLNPLRPYSPYHNEFQNNPYPYPMTSKDSQESTESPVVQEINNQPDSQTKG
jgi:hypothetical protein